MYFTLYVYFFVILKIELLSENLVSLNLKEESMKMYKILC